MNQEAKNTLHQRGRVKMEKAPVAVDAWDFVC
jgi:hypothetical protein